MPNQPMGWWSSGSGTAVLILPCSHYTQNLVFTNRISCTHKHAHTVQPLYVDTVTVPFKQVVGGGGGATKHKKFNNDKILLVQ